MPLSRCRAATARWMSCARFSAGRSWAMHDKPIILLDTAEYWQPLFAMLDRAVEEGFLKPENRESRNASRSCCRGLYDFAAATGGSFRTCIALTDRSQIMPGINAAGVAVVPVEADGIAPHRLLPCLGARAA